MEDIEDAVDPDDMWKDVDEDPYKLEESTLIYDCIEMYVDSLNSNSRLRPEVSDDERQLQDRALYYFENNPDLSKDLVNCYLSTIIKPKVIRKKIFNNKPKRDEAI